MCATAATAATIVPPLCYSCALGTECVPVHLRATRLGRSEGAVGGRGAGRPRASASSARGEEAGSAAWKEVCALKSARGQG